MRLSTSPRSSQGVLVSRRSASAIRGNSCYNYRLAPDETDLAALQCSADQGE